MKILIAINLMILPLSRVLAADNQVVTSQGPQFTPNLVTVEFNSIGTEVPYPQIDPFFQSATISGNFITIGEYKYPIGARFSDASAIHLGSTHDNLLNLFGYAAIQAQGASEYRLLWVTDSHLQKHFMIVKVDSPLFDEQDGFVENYDALIAAEDLFITTLGTAGGSVLTILAVDLGLCPETLGAGCAKAAFVAALAAIGAGVGTIWFFLHDILPAMKNLNQAFINVEINTP